MWIPISLLRRPKSKEDLRRRYMYIAVLGTALFVLGMFLAFRTFPRVLEHMAVQRYAQTTGKVVERWLDSRKNGHGRVEHYTCKVIYRYSAAGEHHVGYRVAYYEPTFRGADEANGFMSRWRAGEPTTVHYDLKFPERSVLLTDAYGIGPGGELFFTASMLLLGAIFPPLALWCYRREAPHFPDGA